MIRIPLVSVLQQPNGRPCLLKGEVQCSLSNDAEKFIHAFVTNSSTKGNPSPFGRRSAVGVAGLLATTDPFFVCFVYDYFSHLVSFALISV